MSSAASQQRILIVSQRHDEPVRAAASLLGQAGAAVTISPDPYHAMAQLVQGPGFAHLILDIRDLDDAELSIITVASRYCPSVACAALVLPGVETRLSRHTSPIRMIDAASLAARIGDGGRPARFAPAHEFVERESTASDDESIAHSLGVDEPAFTSDDSDGDVQPTGESPSGTDERAEEAAATSLYEAVRTRMRDGAAPPIRRRPGDVSHDSADAAVQLPKPLVDKQRMTETGVELTAAEIDALLAIERPASDHPEDAAS